MGTQRLADLANPHKISAVLQLINYNIIGGDDREKRKYICNIINWTDKTVLIGVKPVNICLKNYTAAQLNQICISKQNFAKKSSYGIYIKL